MTNVIVVASGKGGTGKSTVCICLSVALLRQGKRVLLIDCDCGMRGLDIMLDIEQDILFDASDAVCGNCSFAEAIYKSKNNDNLFLMAAPFDAENELSPSVFRQLVDAVKHSYDYVIIDSPAGIGSGFMTAAAPADSALIVTNAEPTSVRGAVKVRKKLEALDMRFIRLVINRFDKKVFRRMGFYPDLDAVIDASQTQLIGIVPFDMQISVVMQRGAAVKALRRLSYALDIDLPGRGIAFLLPLSSVGGSQTKEYLSGASDARQEESKPMYAMQNDVPSHDLIITIINRGFTDLVMQAALPAGARGGTVLHARGAGSRDAAQFLGITIQPEKEMVLILTPHDKKVPIMQAITRGAGLNSEGKGIVFSLPVTDVMGVARMMDTQEEQE